jgi:hypothetical protein
LADRDEHLRSDEVTTKQWQEMEARLMKEKGECIDEIERVNRLLDADRMIHREEIEKVCF